MRSTTITILLLGAFVMAPSANAGPTLSEKLAPTEEWKNTAFARIGIDPSLGVAVGYGRSFRLGHSGRDWLLLGELSAPFRTFGSSGAFSIKAWLPLVRYGYFRFSTEVSLQVGWTHNRNFRSVRLAPGAVLLPGIGGAGGRWFVDGVFGYERAVGNHFTHTDYHREVFYADAKDGWYYGTAGRFRMGLRVGGRLGRWDLELRLAHDRTERFAATNGSPFSISLGAGIRF